MVNEYFLITYRENAEEKQIKADIEDVVIRLVELKRANKEIIKIEDSTDEEYEINEMLDTYKESIEIEYKDVRSKEEAKELAINYFSNFYKKKVISKEQYKRYIETLKKYDSKYDNLEELRNKIIGLYIY